MPKQEKNVHKDKKTRFPLSYASKATKEFSLQNQLELFVLFYNMKL